MKGSKVFIRTVTHNFTGRVEKVTRSWIILSDAAWIADTGVRWSEMFATGKWDGSTEIEPYPKGALVRVARGGIIDIADWKHELPREAK